MLSSSSKQQLRQQFSRPLSNRNNLIVIPRRQYNLPSALPVKSNRIRPFSTSFTQLFPASFKPSSSPKQKLVIVGSGWAGYKFMKKIDKEKYNVHLISPKNYFTFTPLLPSTSVGTLEFRSAIEPVRSDDLTFYEALCKQIDYQNKFITCMNSITKEDFTVSYDKLILACGMNSNTFNIPGVQENACFLKDISHARKIRSKLLENFEVASQPTTTEQEIQRLLHFVVVGGGPTGVEFCAELYDFVSDDVEKKYPHLRKNIRITLYDAAPRILPSFDQQLSDYARQKFIERGINVQTGKGVIEVTDTFLKLKDDGVVPYGLLVWSTGLTANDLIRGMASLPKDRMQRLFTNDQLQVMQKEGQAISDLYAVGDCATIEGYDLPCTAQVAKQKAEYLAKALNANSFAGTGFQYNHKGSMAYIGDRKAVVDMGKGKSSQGILGWLIWRTAYMSMAESLRNKIKIPTYWLLTWMAGRETSRF